MKNLNEKKNECCNFQFQTIVVQFAMVRIQCYMRNSFEWSFKKTKIIDNLLDGIPVTQKTLI
jgi:hypothetical protein